MFGLSATMTEKLSTVEKITPVALLSNVVIFVFLVGMVTLMVWWRVKPVAWLANCPLPATTGLFTQIARGIQATNANEIESPLVNSVRPRLMFSIADPTTQF